MPTQRFPVNQYDDTTHSRGERVARLMYATLSSLTHSVFEEINNIRVHAMDRHQTDMVNVALLYQNGWFMHWMEGPPRSVRAVLNRVSTDPRHQSLQLLHESTGPRRLTEPWSMAVVHTHEHPSAFAARVAVLHEECINQRAMEPATIWRRLSTPLTHPRAAEQAQSDHFQRVMVCSALGTDSFHLVHWLGKTHDAEVVHRRFVGSRPGSLDVGTDYVDLDNGEIVRRVIAMADHGLQIGLAQAFLADYSHVVLLLSGIAERDLSLMHRLLDACAHVGHRPVTVGLGSCDCDHTSLQQLARQGGLIYLDCDIAGDTSPESQWAAAEMMLDRGMAIGSTNHPHLPRPGGAASSANSQFAGI